MGIGKQCNSEVSKVKHRHSQQLHCPMQIVSLKHKRLLSIHEKIFFCFLCTCAPSTCFQLRTPSDKWKFMSWHSPRQFLHKGNPTDQGTPKGKEHALYYGHALRWGDITTKTRGDRCTAILGEKEKGAKNWKERKADICHSGPFFGAPRIIVT